MSLIISKVKALKFKIMLFLLGFFSVAGPLPCRGAACSSCYACFFILPALMFFAFFGRLKRRLAGFSHVWKRR